MPLPYASDISRVMCRLPNERSVHRKSRIVAGDGHPLRAGTGDAVPHESGNAVYLGHVHRLVGGQGYEVRGAGGGLVDPHFSNDGRARDQGGHAGNVHVEAIGGVSRN